MKFSLSLLLVALFVVFAYAVPAGQKQVVVSYPSSTPDSIVDSAMAAIKAAGGVITHKYNLIKGFAATAPAKILDTVQTLGAEYGAVIEEDETFSINS